MTMQNAFIWGGERTALWIGEQAAQMLGPRFDES